MKTYLHVYSSSSQKFKFFTERTKISCAFILNTRKYLGHNITLQSMEDNNTVIYQTVFGYSAKFIGKK